MEFNEKDAEVVKLLTQLKNAEGGYPVEMMALRRQNYMKQVAGLGIGLGAAGALKQIVKAGGGSSIPPAASTLLETILIVAIVAEAGAVALINREKFMDLFRTISTQPRVEEVISTPIEAASPLTELVVPITFEPTMTAITVTPAGTPSPVFLFVTSEAASDSEGTTSHQAVSTPNPQDNNGNQYGLTPKPERTVGPGNGSGGGNGGGGNGGGTNRSETNGGGNDNGGQDPPGNKDR